MPRALRRALLPMVLAGLGAATPDARAAGAPAPRYAPRPSWVVPVEPAAPSDGPAPGGVDYLLMDDQVRLAPDRAEHWARRVRRVTGGQGVDAESRFQLDWDPAYETLTIHRVAVRRDGRLLDRLDRASVEIVRREPHFEASLLDGTLSALVVVRDVRAGDVVEHEFTISGTNPVFGARWFGGFTVHWDLPVRRLAFRVAWPEGRDLRWRAFGTDATPALSAAGGMREASWLVEGSPAADPCGDEPPWFDAAGWVQLSEFASWRDVAAWALPLYSAPKPSSELAQVVARCAAERDDEARALAALRFVQDDVRYLGLEHGTGSHQPCAPDLVLERRFGDCKDKALLLVTILRALGIGAQPAFVSTADGGHVAQRLPSPGVFDHVVVRALVAGRERWLDPTIASQRGPLSSRHVPRFGRALVVAPGTDDLSEVVPAEGDLPRTTVDVRYVLPRVGSAASMAIRTTYEGRDADDERAMLAAETLEQTEREYAEYYARDHDVERLRPLVVRDDEARNVLVTEEAYRIPQPWALGDDRVTWTASFRAPEIEAVLAEPDVIRRETPLGIDHPKRVLWRATLELPDDWGIAERDETIHGPAATFRASVRREPRRLLVEHEWTTLHDAVPASQVPRHVALVREALEATAITLAASLDGRPTPPPRGAATNWSVVALTLVTAAASAGVSALAFAWRRRAPEPEPRLRGLRLALASAFSLALPAVLLAALVRGWPAFALDRWTELSTPGGASWHPLAAPLLLAWLILAVAAIPPSVVLWPMLVLGRRAFPLTLTAVTCAASSLAALQALASRAVTKAMPGALDAGTVALLLLGAAFCLLVVLRPGESGLAVSSPHEQPHRLDGSA